MSEPIFRPPAGPSEDFRDPLPYTMRETRGFLLLMVIFLVIDLVIAFAVHQMDYRTADLILFFTFSAIYGSLACQFLLLVSLPSLLLGSPLLRIGLGALLGGLLFLWVSFWLLMSGPGGRLKDIGYALLYFQMFYFAAQLPLWAVRWWFSLRIVGSIVEDPRGLAPRKLGLAHLFLWSFFLAVPLAILRFLASWELQRDPLEVLAFVSIWAVCLWLGTLVTALAFLWITLGSRRPVRAALVVLLSAVVVTAGLALAFSHFFRLRWEDIPELSQLFVGGTVGALLTIIPTKLVLRASGLRLVIGRGGQPAAE